MRLVLKLLLVQYQQKSQVLENNIYAAAQMPEVLVTQLDNAVMMQRCQDRFESLPLSISTSRLPQLSTFKVLYDSLWLLKFGTKQLMFERSPVLWPRLAYSILRGSKKKIGEGGVRKRKSSDREAGMTSKVSHQNSRAAPAHSQLLLNPIKSYMHHSV